MILVSALPMNFTILIQKTVETHFMHQNRKAKGDGTVSMAQTLCWLAFPICITMQIRRFQRHFYRNAWSVFEKTRSMKK